MKQQSFSNIFIHFTVNNSPVKHPRSGLPLTTLYKSSYLLFLLLIILHLSIKQSRQQNRVCAWKHCSVFLRSFHHLKKEPSQPCQPLRLETPIQYPCCSRERLWVVEGLKGRYRNGRMKECPPIGVLQPLSIISPLNGRTDTDSHLNQFY